MQRLLFIACSKVKKNWKNLMYSIVEYLMYNTTIWKEIIRKFIACCLLSMYKVKKFFQSNEYSIVEHLMYN